MEAKEAMEKMLVQAYEDLPPGNYHRLATIPGIGDATAAVLTSKIGDIARFDSPRKLVGYFGIYPEVCSSGVERDGEVREGRQTHMSRKGTIWCGPTCGTPRSPASLTTRCSRPSTPVSARPACAATWPSGTACRSCSIKSGRSGAPVRTSIRNAICVAEQQTPVAAQTAASTSEPKETAAGPTRESSPSNKEVTAAVSSVAPPNGTVNTNASAPSRSLDFEHVRSQLPIERVLELLDHRSKLVVNGKQLRGPCPLHAPHKARSRHFSANTEKNVFRCFAPECQAHGNALDLYAAATKLPVHEAAWKLVDLLHLEPTRTEKRNP